MKLAIMKRWTWTRDPILRNGARGYARSSLGSWEKRVAYGIVRLERGSGRSFFVRFKLENEQINAAKFCLW